MWNKFSLDLDLIQGTVCLITKVVYNCCPLHYEYDINKQLYSPKHRDAKIVSRCNYRSWNLLVEEYPCYEEIIHMRPVKGNEDYRCIPLDCPLNDFLLTPMDCDGHQKVTEDFEQYKPCNSGNNKNK